jgi:hypothetical protein
MLGIRVDASRSARLTPKADVVSRRLKDSAVLIDLSTNGIFELNETGCRVWELLHEGLSTEAMVDRLHQEFGVEPPRAAAEVEALLTSLRLAGLVGESG